MPLLYVPLAAAATLVFTPVAVVARAVMRQRDVLLGFRSVHAEIRPRWLSDGSLDVSMLVRNRLATPVRIASATVLRPRGTVLSGQPAHPPRSTGVPLNLPLPAADASADWVGLRARLPRGWLGGRMTLRLTLATETTGRAHNVVVRTTVPHATG